MLSAAGAAAHTKAPAATDWAVQAQNPRDRNYGRNVWGRLWKKLHLLWKPKSTSRCEYYKAFISCSFIVFPPISGELLPSSGHCVNSLSLSSIRCLLPQWHETLQQSCSENCREDGAGINLKVLPGKQSKELIQIHHLVPSRVSGSIPDFESSLMWCVNYIITIIIKYVHLWQGSDSNQSFLVQGAERIHVIWDFDCGQCFLPKSCWKVLKSWKKGNYNCLCVWEGGWNKVAHPFLPTVSCDV